MPSTKENWLDLRVLNLAYTHRHDSAIDMGWVPPATPSSGHVGIKIVCMYVQGCPSKNALFHSYI